MDNESVDEIKRHVSVVAESLRGEIRIVAEGQSVASERLDRIESRLDRIDSRLDRVDVHLDGHEHRMGRIETRMAEESAEIKAMIRLSFV